MVRPAYFFPDKKFMKAEVNNVEINPSIPADQ